MAVPRSQTFVYEDGSVRTTISTPYTAICLLNVNTTYTLHPLITLQIWEITQAPHFDILYRGVYFSQNSIDLVHYMAHSSYFMMMAHFHYAKLL